jgi:hypothetical protein
LMLEPDYDYFYCYGEIYREQGVWDTKGCTIILEIWDRSKQEWVPSKPMNGEWVYDPYNGDNDRLIRKISRDEAYRNLNKIILCKDPVFQKQQREHHEKSKKEKDKMVFIKGSDRFKKISEKDKTRLQVKIGDKPKVELIKFTNSRTGSQYPDCKHAMIDMTKNWSDRVDGVTHYIPYVRCALSIPKHGQRQLCMDLNETGVCQYELGGVKLENFPWVKCANCLYLSSRRYLLQRRGYPTIIYCRKRGIPIDDDYWVERFCTEFVPWDYNETESNSIQELWHRWSG